VAWFATERNQHRLDALLKQITVSEVDVQSSDALAGTTVVFTGTLASVTRDEAKELARRAGAQVSSSVSKHTSFVVAGEAPGSKVEKAQTLNVPVKTEAEFLALVGHTVVSE
jgi:DNA ligase (NAD+)